MINRKDSLSDISDDISDICDRNDSLSDISNRNNISDRNNSQPIGLSCNRNDKLKNLTHSES